MYLEMKQYIQFIRPKYIEFYLNSKNAFEVRNNK